MKYRDCESLDLGIPRSSNILGIKNGNIETRGKVKVRIWGLCSGKNGREMHLFPWLNVSKLENLPIYGLKTILKLHFDHAPFVVLTGKVKYKNILIPHMFSTGETKN